MLYRSTLTKEVIKVEGSKKPNLTIVTLRYAQHPNWLGRLFGKRVEFLDVKYIGSLFSWKRYPDFGYVEDIELELFLSDALRRAIYLGDVAESAKW